MSIDIKRIKKEDLDKYKVLQILHEDKYSGEVIVLFEKELYNK